MQVLLLIALSIFSCLFTQKVDPGDKILGTWVNEEQTTHIEIYREDGKFFGRIVWLPVTTDVNGDPLRDKNNPDSELRDRPILGIPILEDFEYKNGEYVEGTIYSPKNGKKAKPTLQLTSDDELSIKIKKGVIRRTVTWKRV